MSNERIDNEEIARALGWTLEREKYADPVWDWRWSAGYIPVIVGGYDRWINFSTPDGLAEVKAWVEAKGWDWRVVYNAHLRQMNAAITGELYAWYGEGTSEADAFLRAFVAAHKESTG